MKARQFFRHAERHGRTFPGTGRLFEAEGTKVLEAARFLERHGICAAMFISGEGETLTLSVPVHVVRETPEAARLGPGRPVYHN